MSEFEAWLETRPKVIQEMGRQCPPDREYRIKSTGQTCVLYSYSESRTVTVDITSPTFENMVGRQRRVFGISIDDLEPLPEKDSRGTCPYYDQPCICESPMRDKMCKRLADGQLPVR